MKSLEVGKTDTIVCYESSATDGPKQGPYKWACRAAWILNTFGCTNVNILDGGLPKWKAENRELEEGKWVPQGLQKDTSFRLDTRVIKYLEEVSAAEMD